MSHTWEDILLRLFFDVVIRYAYIIIICSVHDTSEDYYMIVWYSIFCACIRVRARLCIRVIGCYEIIRGNDKY